MTAVELSNAVLALTDQATVDAWAREQTDGRIPAMPALIGEDTLMLLASALSVRTRWLEPFVAGPLLWEGRRVEGLQRAGTDAARVLDGPVTVVSVEGDNDVTVELALGEGPAHEALIALLRGGPGVPLAEGAPGVRLAPAPQVSVPRFTVNAAHDLLTHADLFGLVAAQDKTRGHFPGLSDFPLAVDAAAQVITASFGAEGFESDAIATVSLAAGGHPPEPEHLAVSFDRPFAFAVRLRSTGLLLLAGCVTEP